MDRRVFLSAAASTALFPLSDVAGAGPVSLRAAAARKGVRFGCAVRSGQLASDATFAGSVAQQAGIVVPEYELKRNTVQPSPNGFDFSGSDKIVAFAAANRMQMRGHAFCWFAANPAWLEALLRDATVPAVRKRAAMTGYINAALGRYRGRIGEWDVVNEPINPDEGRDDGMRVKNAWSETFGERYIDMAFAAARAADPKVRLFINDYGIESDHPWCEKRRTATLKLLDRLKGRGVPIDGYGIQGHLKPYKAPFNERIFSNFLEKLNGYGLQLAITEMDFMDRYGPADPRQRDVDVAAMAKSFLDVSLANRSMKSVLTWGLSDKDSWLSTKWSGDRWPDGQFARALPFAANWQPKLLYRTMLNCFANAPAR